MDRSAPPCGLCGSPTEEFSLSTGTKVTRYHSCPVCGHVFTDKANRLGRPAQKARYLKHENSPQDPGYTGYLREFLSLAVIPFVRPGASVLDFGSGPNPVLAGLASEAGYSCDIYDPFFAKTRAWKKRLYGCVMVHEVLEHLEDPAAGLRVIMERLSPGGVIAVRTRFLPSDRRDFASWWYRMDPTHVSFFTAGGLARFFTARGLAVLLERPPDILVSGRRAEDALK